MRFSELVRAASEGKECAPVLGERGLIWDPAGEPAFHHCKGAWLKRAEEREELGADGSERCGRGQRSCANLLPWPRGGVGSPST